MDNEIQRNNAFIEKLVNLSKTPDVLKWEYLDQNDLLLDKTKFLFKKSSNLIILDLSFYFSKDNSYVIIFTLRDLNNNKSNALMILPDTFRNPKLIGGNEYQQTLTRLINIVKKRFPGPDDFIDSILDI